MAERYKKNRLPVVCRRLAARRTTLFSVLLTLAACATATGPPGKSQFQLDSEGAMCRTRATLQTRYIKDIELAWAQCMINYGNTVHLTDGRTFAPPNYGYQASPYSPYYQPPPHFNPPEGPTVAVVPNPGKSFDAFQADQNICKGFAQGTSSQQQYDTSYSQCMYSRGNQVPGYGPPSIASNDEEDTRSPPEYTPEPVPSYPTPERRSSPSSTEPPSSPRANSSVPTLFRTIVIANQEIILLAAHPSGTIDNKNVTIEQNDANGAVIVDAIDWHAKRSFRTTLRFELSYDNEGAVSSVKIDVEETSDPAPAFLAADIAKQLIMHYASDKAKNSIFKAVLKTINSNTSVERGLEEFLKYLVNHPEES